MPKMNEDSEKFVSNVRFVPNGNGLEAHFDFGALQQYRLEPGEKRRELMIEAEVSPDHGIMTVPVRLPRYLRPEWSQADWNKFVDGEIGLLLNFVDEAVVQGLSLALVADNDIRKSILRTGDEVVIDFRGDLPNKYLPMVLGGYKVGVYRSGNNWPAWLSIQPTYDLALKEAESIRTEAGLPKKSITTTGKLSNFLKADMGQLIQSASANSAGRWWLAVAAVVVVANFFVWG